MFRWIYSNNLISKVFLGLVAFSFIIGTAILWGPGGLNLGSNSYVIKVDDIVITPKEFYIELSNLQQKYNFSKKILEQQALNNLLTLAVLAYLSEKDGFWVYKDEIINFLKKNFRNKGGKFNEKIFEDFLKRMHITPELLENIIKKWLLANKYKKAVYSTVYSDDLVLETLILPFSLKLKVRIYQLSYKDFDLNLNPTDKELRKFYEQLGEKFFIKIPARIEIYKASNLEEARNLISSLKERKQLKPYKIIPLNSTIIENKTLQKLIQKVKLTKNISVISTNSTYYIGVYRSEERKKLTYKEIKEELKKLYRKYKTVEWIHKHSKSLVNNVLEGKYKTKKIYRELIAYELLNKYRLSIETLFKILEREKKLVIKTSNGLVIIEIISFYKEKLPKQVLDLYYLQVKNSIYIIKLQEILQNFYRNSDADIEINKRYLE